MGKRGRQQTVKPKALMKPVWHRARVRVDDETWAEFRRLLGERSVAEALGSHMEREFARWRLERATHAELSEREVLEALERVEAAKATLEALAGRLERRLPVRRPG